MSTATLTTKGQLTLPKEIRDDLALKPGDKVEFIKIGNRYHLIPRNKRISDFAGILGNPLGRTVSVEEMNEAVREEAAERHRRTYE
jgi:antitoxin PrlF